MADRMSTVWMVSALTGLEGRKGHLSLKGRTLVFRPDSARFGDSVFDLASVTRVRRARGSPVLELHLDVIDAPTVIGFYFVEPPPIRLPDTRFRMFPRYLARRSAVAELTKGNAVKREEVIWWVEEIERIRGD